MRAIKKNGSALLFVALVVMAFLTITAFLIDIAGGLMIRNRLQAMADHGADAGMNALSDLILEKATAREPNPPDGADPRAFLTEEDRQAILVDGRPRIEQAVNSSVDKNRISSGLTPDLTDIQYPIRPRVDCNQANERVVELRVTIKYKHPILFQQIWNRAETPLEAVSLQTMSLCP